jgi:ABC-type antimicrobial peptide transport system permease subunit
VFQLGYTFQELRRRLGRTILTALGLALGVGLVIGIIGVSQGLDDAQGDVLAPLRSVGTDILVTRVTGTTTNATGSTTTTTAPTGQAGGGLDGGPGGGRGFFAGRGSGEAQQNRQDTQELLSENQSVITDLSKLGKPGDKFTHDFFLSATLQSFPESAVSKIKKVDGVETAVGGLVQLAEHQTGTVPQIVASIQTGGQTFTQTVRPEPMTDAERAAFRTCLESKGVTIGPAAGEGPPDGGGQGGGGGGGGFRGNPAFDDCLPARFKEFRAQFTTPLETIQQVVNPPSTDITSQSYTAAAVDPSQPDVGLVTRDQLTAGRWLATASPNEVLVNVAYANTKSLKVGATIPINGVDYKIVGLVRPTLTGSTADIYFPLATLQKLATKENRVTQVLVKAKDADSVDAVAASIKKQLPGAEVVTTKGLADQVTGSLADAHELSGRLGTALAIIVLGAAFVIAALLTLASISKRVREIGTLRAIGWSNGRVVRQLLTETIGIGLLGGILGIGVGIVVVAVINALSPSLSATTANVPGLNGSSLAGVFGQTTTVVRTTSVSLTAALHPSTLLLGVLFALVGGVLAGLIGGWRAARLSPVVALRDLG